MKRCRWNKTARDEARADIRKILSLAPDEVVGVRDALANGRIDGSVYSGDCCCLVGTIAKLRQISILTQISFYPLERAIRADQDRPAEKFFGQIEAGDTPANNGYSRLALKWVDEWIEEYAAQHASALVESSEVGALSLIA